MSDTAIQTQAPAPAVEFNPNDMNQLMKLAETFARSTMVPKDYIGKPENCFVSMLHGHKLGLDPVASLQAIANINGKPSLYGDHVLALVKIHPDFEGINETWPDENSATCEIKRRGEDAVSRTFTVAMAQKAGLWKKAGPWTNYPQRMLQMRARSWAVRDCFPDAINGLSVVEEARDIVIPVQATVSDTGKGNAGLKKLLLKKEEPQVEEVEAVVVEQSEPPFADTDIQPDPPSAEEEEAVPCEPETVEQPEEVEKAAKPAAESNPQQWPRSALIAEVYKRGKPILKAKNKEDFWVAASGEDFLGREVTKVQQVQDQELVLLIEMFKEQTPGGRSAS